MSQVDNRQHIDVSQGKLLRDGVEVTDAVSFYVDFTPVTSTSRTLGHTGEDTRWKTFTLAGAMSEYRSTPWLIEAIKEYRNTGKTPEFTLTGIVTDESSDYYKEYGGQTVTVTGCIPSGAIRLLELDANGDLVQDTINFTAKDVQFG